MKHTHISYALVALLAIVLVGCEPKGPTEISVTPNENVILFPNLGESTILQLSSTADWSASIVYKGSVDGWLRVYPSSGTMAENQEITLMALKANTTIDDRRAIITFTHAQGAQVSVEVTQAYNPNLAPRFDPKFAQVLKDKGYIADTENILLSEVKSIRMLEIQNCGLTSLAGIEYFYALFSIQCQSNSLTSLDLSHSPELDFVECFNNKLTSLDFSNNSQLRLLYCMQNKLTSLNLRNCSRITQMWCNSNELTSVDVSDCTSLRDFSCMTNAITELDVSNNLNLESLKCASNQLTSINLGVNNNLQTLECHLNALVTLDISGVTGLNGLDCMYNNLVNIDISSNSSLTSFNCISNYGDDDNIFKVKAWFSGEPPANFTTGTSFSPSKNATVTVEYVTEF